MSRPAVFLDRDGTIIEGIGFLGDPKEVRLIPGAKEALQSLCDAGFLLIVLTNQSGIARGYFTPKEAEAVNARTNALLGDLVHKWYYCPHHPTEGDGEWTGECDCRKPKKGMLHRACKELDIRIEGSVAIGDQTRDLTLFSNLPVKTILVLTGKGQETLSASSDFKPDHVCRDLKQAAALILSGQVFREPGA